MPHHAGDRACLLNLRRLAAARYREFRDQSIKTSVTGYYVGNNQNIPVCFSKKSIPTGWACDSDWTAIDGWIDISGGEFCAGNQSGAPRKWAKGGNCSVYAANPPTAYGLALR